MSARVTANRADGCPAKQGRAALCAGSVILELNAAVPAICASSR